MKRFNIKSKAKLCLLILGTVVISCKKDLKQSSSLTENEATMPRAVYTNITENFNSYSNGISYPNTLYVQDFGNNQSPFSWVTNRTYISNPTGNDGSLRIKLLANQYGSSAGGVIGKTLISDGNSTEYQVKFKLKFASDFQFSLGGKLGLGLGFGKALAGCKGDSARAGFGGSVRLMWNRIPTGTPNVYNWKLKPYMYHKRMPTTSDCGGESEAYPSGNNNLEKDVWYSVVMKAGSNTATGSNNGYIYITIQKDGEPSPTVLINRGMEWGNGDYRKITTLMFDTFRGGDNTSWNSTTDGYIYYDNIEVTKLQ